MSIHVEPLMPPPHVVVIGCGHVGSAVVHLAHWLGCRVTAIDDREQVADPTRLVDADAVLAGPLADSLAAAELAREERAAKLASTAEPEPEPDTPQWSEEEVGAGGVGRLWTDGAEEQGARADGSNVLGFVPQRPRP